MQLELKSKCPACEVIRTLWGPFKVDNDADLDAAEALIDIKKRTKTNERKTI
jgi:tRNA G26 N,N-dimethylase Trm1